MISGFRLAWPRPRQRCGHSAQTRVACRAETAAASPSRRALRHRPVGYLPLHRLRPRAPELLSAWHDRWLVTHVPAPERSDRQASQDCRAPESVAGPVRLRLRRLLGL